MNKHSKILTIILGFYLLLNFPLCAYAETYLYSDIGSESFSMDGNQDIWFDNGIQKVDLPPIFINSPGGKSFSKILGFGIYVDTEYDYGRSESETDTYLTFYGVRDDGSIGESYSIFWNGWREENDLDPRSFEKVFQGDYVKLKVEPTIYCYDYNKLENYNFNGSITFWSGGYIPPKETYNSIINAANSAASNATNAFNAANVAKSSADAAKTEATNAKNQATSAANTVNNGYNNNGKSLTATYDKANSAARDISYIRNDLIPNIDNSISIVSNDVNNLKTDITNLSNQITNIENNQAEDTTPPTIIKIKGYNGATCTTNSTFKLVVEATDNKSGSLEFRAKPDTGDWSDWASTYNNLTLGGILGIGAHEIQVEVRDNEGNISTGNITIFRL